MTRLSQESQWLADSLPATMRTGSEKRKRQEPVSDTGSDSDCIELSARDAHRRPRQILTDVNVAQAQNKRQRVMQYVLIPRPSKPWYAVLQQNPQVKFQERKRDAKIHTAAPATPWEPDELPSSHGPTPISFRPRRATVHRSYLIDDALSGDSADELAEGIVNLQSLTKKPARTGGKVYVEDSDFVDSDKTSEQESEAYSSDSGHSQEDSSIAPGEPDSADEGFGSSRKRKPTTAASARTARATATQIKAGPGTGKRKSQGKASSKNMKTILGRYKGAPKGLDTNLPLLCDINDIFVDISLKALNKGLAKVTDHLGSRPLRVATMCSGTESPLLALQKIQEALKSLKKDSLEVDHVFSAEIVPFKQAYIERNFRPPIIFRDITELSNAVNDEVPKATTAYGARVPVPKDVDILVAGTSCVDFSRMNKHRKGLGDGGESADTWGAVRTYCEAFRPAIVLLENVKTAHWDAMLQDYQDIGYESAGVLVDTKDYYLPQTRQRGYMVCFDKERMKNSGVAGAGKLWQTSMEHFKRYASSSVSEFLLPCEAVNARQLVRLDEKLRDFEWTQCENRHIVYRQEMRLGNARPFTHWQESGTILPPENGSADFFRGEVDRVKDMIDCSYLRNALPKRGMYDSRFKTRIWDLSQNVDLFEDTTKSGIVPCITPSGNFYCSDLCRRLTPEELFILQGLPLDKISFTTESQQNIQDMAGNAMSTTVIGCAILAALDAAYKLVDVSTVPAAATMPLEPCEVKLISNECEQVKAETQLVQIDFVALIDLAQATDRKCFCESTGSLAKKPIQQCIDCGHTTCTGCGGNPAHNYRRGALLSAGRKPARTFEQRLRSDLPLRLQFTDVKGLECCLEGEDLSDGYRAAVIKAFSGVYSFSRVKRRHKWTTIWEAPSAHLELSFEDDMALWRLFALPDTTLSTSSPLFQALTQPVARSTAITSLDSTTWQWRIPAKHAATATVVASEVRVASWWARNQMPDFLNHTVPDRLTITVPTKLQQRLDRPIDGIYQHLPRCGTACDSLYKRLETDDRAKPLYLFLDPTSTGDPKEDTFVFSSNISRVEYDEVRSIVARMHPSWSPWAEDAAVFRNPQITLESTWTSLPARHKLVIPDGELIVRSPGDSALTGGTICVEANSLVECSLTTKAVRANHQQERRLISADNARFFNDHRWVFEAMRRHFPTTDWRTLEIGHMNSLCRECAPIKPALRWKLGEDNQTIKPYEDSASAAAYERAIKVAPSLLIVEAGFGPLNQLLNIKFGVNTVALVQKARARLPAHVKVERAICKLNMGGLASETFSLTPFQLTATTGVKPYTRNLGMSCTLFPKQQLVLAWMRQQEAGQGRSFTLEESEEATIPGLGWGSEVRVQASISVRGGICADHPGFGKTITSLALINSQFLDHSPEEIVSELKGRQDGVADGLIPIAATFIVCPHTLVKQWQCEISEKLRIAETDKSSVIAISSVMSLSRYNIEDFKEAKIVLINRSLFGNEKYAERLASFAGVPDAATNVGRSYAQWLQFATSKIPENLEVLERRGLSGLKLHVKAQYRTHLDSEEFRAMVPSKRLRGKEYVAEKAGKNSKTQATKAAASSANVDGIGAPLLEMFYPNRLIVDEYHQYEPKEYAAITALKADKRWGLSATPAMSDTYDTARMAELLGIPLNYGTGTRHTMKLKNIQKMTAEMTDFERFDNMRQIPSDATQYRIHERHQKFLDKFVTRNIMDFTEMTYTDKLIPVQLDLDHHVGYTELSQQLNSQDMKIKKSNKAADTEREVSVNKAVQGVESAEEALSRTAAFIDRRAEAKSQLPGLKHMAWQRQKDRDRFRSQLSAAVKQAQQIPNPSLEKWAVAKLHDGLLGDETVITEVAEMIRLDGARPGKTEKLAKRSKVRSEEEEEEDSAGDSSSGKNAKATDLTREVSIQARRLLIAQRSLRLAQSVLHLHQASSAPTKTSLPTIEKCDSKSCRRCNVPVSQMAVSSLCGHLLCEDCYKHLKASHATMCPAEGCKSALDDYHLLWVHKMGNLSKPTHTPFGAKIEATLDLLDHIRARGDQAIVFVQYANQLNELETALKDRGMQATVVKESAGAGEQIANFRTRSTDTVIVLNASDETAAGSNLQNANHVVFLSPLLRDTQYGYESTMAQAIGRVRRHGQKKPIHVYRVGALDTIDVDIWEHRERRTTSLSQQGQPEIKPPPAATLQNQVQPPRPERTQLVRENGLFSLRPRSWLVRCGADENPSEDLKSARKNGIHGWEDYSSLVKFSRAYTEDDE